MTEDKMECCIGFDRVVPMFVHVRFGESSKGWCRYDQKALYEDSDHFIYWDMDDANVRWIARQRVWS